MLEIIIRLEERERIFKAFSMDSSEAVKEELVSYLNSRVNDYEQSVEMQKVIDEYRFIPLTELVEESPLEDPEEPIEEPDEPI